VIWNRISAFPTLARSLRPKPLVPSLQHRAID
jgi:hypothetical protein